MEELDDKNMEIIEKCTQNLQQSLETDFGKELSQYESTLIFGEHALDSFDFRFKKEELELLNTIVLFVKFIVNKNGHAFFSNRRNDLESMICSSVVKSNIGLIFARDELESDATDLNDVSDVRDEYDVPQEILVKSQCDVRNVDKTKSTRAAHCKDIEYVVADKTQLYI